MQMLTKFESKSNRVKGIAFHPKLALLASSLHNGSIQLWNYQTGTIYERLEDHEGPVRGICFHPTQPLLVSGGDDYKIKVWNHKTGKVLFTLHGHLDYVRSVFFHHEHPWIISASDDQTIRIWNWQSRTCIAILTGHNHYVMCAQFHPYEDLIVSASMDQTVRVWDYTALKQKSTTAQPMSLDEQMARASSAQMDLFGHMDVMVKYVLEGHERGVNWAAFHPALPLIVSASDDRTVKLWRMSETKAWEVDTCRGHYNNVSAALFHPHAELILSVSEDKTIRVWDMGKRTAVQTFRREHDRFWVLTAHPQLNLFAAGHDSGLIVFKLERERPPFALHNNVLYYVRNKQVYAYDYASDHDTALLSIKRLGNQYVQPRTLSYNPAEHSIIVTSVSGDSGVYDIAPLPHSPSAELGESGTVGKRGSGNSALFIARNRFAVLLTATQHIEIRDLANNVVKTLVKPDGVTDIFHGGPSHLLLSTPSSVLLYDTQQQATTAELAVPAVKYVVWNQDGSMVALLSKHAITLTDKHLSFSHVIHETIRIKSAAWDSNGVLLYSTLNHIKYALPNGDTGIIRTLEQPLYLTRVKGATVNCLDRQACPRTLTIDPTECRFKLALLHERYDDVLSIIRTSRLVGQSIIAYLQKKGYPEIALHFVQDKTTRFDLAVECGNLDVALETAEALNVPEIWTRLGDAALLLGDQQIVERAYQKTKSFDQLSFLYLITGNMDKLEKMTAIAERRGNTQSLYHNAVFAGDTATQATVLESASLDALAFITAENSGDSARAAAIAAQVGLDEQAARTALAASGAPNAKGAPTPITETHAYNWPLKSTQTSYFDQVLAESAEGGVIFEDNAVQGTTHDLDSWLDGGALEEEMVDAEPLLDLEGDEAAWDLDESAVAPAEEVLGQQFVPLADADTLQGAVPGSAESAHWLRNSPVAADLAAAGAFDAALQLLHRQAGIVAFAPLKPYLWRAYAAARVLVPGAPGAAPLLVHLRRNNELSEGDLGRVLPATPMHVAHLSQHMLQEAYRAVSANKLPEAEAQFRALLHALVLTPAANEEEAATVVDMLGQCREYLVGVSIELERRALAQSDPANVARNLELAALFTHVQMQPQHQMLALRIAMMEARRVSNLAMAGHFARRLLELQPPAKVVQVAQQILAMSDRQPRDAVPVPGYSAHEGVYVICAGSHTLIPSGGAGALEDPLTGAKYLPEFLGTLCRVSEISEVGKLATGLRNLA
ncbi:hypothetical protein MVES1_001325 [Malassezia vespertilionis]|uniref:Coatomer subunit alpha n=1 Tax=Malassezia vespertilionis TaxID=2020962 RepID=A0A2N1JEM6_9BASI|nr:uncharacterized protein MVES1_001325 [Malassezia vespertilionis]PKI84976.1 hypothetical protein MVES_001244 [Malassezia vespertilionis]WFD05987.1 hypothetical protein MVES1_001325 [Malassezia vespertilionis]